MKTKVILGMSGGVDSSVSALLLQKQGYEVIGFFMNASPSNKPPWPSSIEWKNEQSILEKICKKLNIKLIIKDSEKGYEEKVIKPMFKDYARGLTPNPDILCNNVGKFPSLVKLAKQHKADYIATGHYARIKHTSKGPQLFQGKDKEKDQSYFLVGLPQSVLKKCLFPLGDLTKKQVREIARINGFDNADKRSSRGVCYLGKIDMKSFLKQRIKPKPGKIKDPEGNIIGEHPGTFYFTIGEKLGEGKGTKIDNKIRNIHGGKWYVAQKKGNTLIVAPKNHSALKTKKVKIIHFKLINKNDFPKTNLKARIRHLGKLIPGKLKITRPDANRVSHKIKLAAARNGESNSKTISFTFSKPQEGVAEGQSIVLYKGEKLIGGGEIRL